MSAVQHETSVLEHKSLSAPDETRPMGAMGSLEVVALGAGSVGRGTFEPGWKWSEHVKPIVGTDSCEVAHSGYCVSGRMVVRFDTGEEIEVAPGDVVVMPPRHDAWVVGDEPCVFIDWQGFGEYAKAK